MTSKRLGLARVAEFRIRDKLRERGNKMKHGVQNLLDQLAESLLREEYGKARELLAPWLEKESRGGIEVAIKAQIAQTCDVFSDQYIGSADTAELDDNSMTASDLRGEGVDLSPEVTDSNFLGWCCISIQANDGKQSLYDLWCAVVRVGATVCVGYFEVSGPG